MKRNEAKRSKNASQNIKAVQPPASAILKMLRPDQQSQTGPIRQSVQSSNIRPSDRGSQLSKWKTSSAALQNKCMMAKFADMDAVLIEPPEAEKPKSVLQLAVHASCAKQGWKRSSLLHRRLCAREALQHGSISNSCQRAFK